METVEIIAVMLEILSRILEETPGVILNGSIYSTKNFQGISQVVLPGLDYF